MFPYIVAGLACLLFFWGSFLVEFLSGSSSSPSAYGGGRGRVIPRTPRPAVNESLLALEEDDEDGGLRCPPDRYVVHVLSKAPLVLYVENFLDEDERAHLLDIR